MQHHALNLTLQQLHRPCHHMARQRVGQRSVCARGPLPKVPVCRADTLKLNFPAAWTASVLAWGYLEFQDVSPACQLSSLHGCLTYSLWMS